MPASKLTSKSTVLLFAYAPAGLGHLRVTDALYYGLPTNAAPLLLGSQDKRITYIHRLMSVHDITRTIFEWLERGKAEDITTSLYRWLLRMNSGLLYQQLTTIIDQSMVIPETLIIVATHFGLAHQAAHVKEQLKIERGIHVKVVVQVTDDSPHHIWYVPGADIIFVPSAQTKEKLLEYGRAVKLPEVNIEVNPYPLSPHLNTALSQTGQHARSLQYDPHATTPIHVAIPISGAAVGTNYMKCVIDALHQKSHRFFSHVVSKNAPFTYSFIFEMNNRSYVDVQTSRTDKRVIEMYEKLYSQKTIGLEITKPSEQAFKALMSPDKRGGSMMFFSTPVGRQEYDNLDFLRRHHLIPFKTDQKEMWNYARKDVFTNTQELRPLITKAGRWRGLMLPTDPKEAANFIWWCIQVGVLRSMQSCRNIDVVDNNHEYELRPDGVDEFWKKTEDLLI